MRQAQRWIPLLTIAILLISFLPGSAGAAPFNPVYIELNPGSGEAGTMVAVTARDYINYYNQSISIDWDTDGNNVGKITIDQNDGSGTGWFTVPVDAIPGTHTIIVCSGCGSDRSKGTFEVKAGYTPPPPAEDTPTNTKMPGVPNTPTFTPTRTPTPTATLLTSVNNVAPAQALFNNPDSPLGMMTSRLPLDPPCGSLRMDPASVVVTFDDLPAGSLSGIAPYVQIVSGSGLVASPPIAARSGSQALTSQFSDVGSINYPISMSFNHAMQAVGLFVGREAPSSSAYESIVAVLTGFGTTTTGLAKVVARTQVELPGYATPIDRCLVIHAPEGEVITSASLEYYDSSGHSVYDRRWMDDLTLQPVAGGPRNLAPTVRIISPVNGQVVTTDGVLLQVEITEDLRMADTYGLMYHINTTGSGSIPYTRDSLNPQLYRANIPVTEGLNRFGSNTIEVGAMDYYGEVGRATVTFTYQPESAVDIVVDAIELTQATQYMFDTDMPDNWLPMIVGKPTMARLYAHILSGPASLSGISGILCQGETGNGGCTNPLRPTFPVTLTNSADLTALRNDIHATLNFLIPAGWLSADNGLLLVTGYANFAQENAAECCNDNNHALARAEVLAGRTLNVTIFPIRANGVEPHPNSIGVIAAGLADVYPVNRVQWYPQSTYNAGTVTFTNDSWYAGWDWLLNDLDMFRIGQDWSVSNLHYYGMVERSLIAGTGAYGGMGRTPGYVSAGWVDPGNPLGTASVAAEEIGHNHGRQHASATGNALNPDPSYPNSTGTLDQVGINVRSTHLYPITSGDYMSYNRAADRWSSAYTYDAMYLAICSVAFDPFSNPRVAAAPQKQAQAGMYLTGAGIINPTGLDELRPLFLIERSTPLYDSLPAGPYTLELQDASGQVLFTRGFGIPEDDLSEPSDFGEFTFVTPWYEGARSIIFKYNNQEIGRLDASPNLPEVTVVVPNGGENWGASGTQSVSWQGFDPDASALTYQAQYTCDAGLSWTPLGGQTTDTSLSVDVSMLPGGSQCRVRVLASDGFNTTSDISDADFTAEIKAPIVYLSNPQEGSELPAGWPVILSVTAGDAEDGPLPADSIQWTTDVNGIGGSGDTFVADVKEMSAGQHTITVSVTDTDGLSSSASTTIELVAPPPAAVNPASEQAKDVKRDPRLILYIGAGVAALVVLLLGVILGLRKKPKKQG